VFAVQSHYTEVFANLPMTPAALRDDVASDAAQRWFSTAELKSLNASQSVDFVFVSELYMMQEIIKAVCFICILLMPFSGACKCVQNPVAVVSKKIRPSSLIFCEHRI